MRVVLSVLTSVLLVAGVAPATAQTPPEPATEPALGAATMVPGTAAYADGEWAYTDYVYDDTGAGGGFAYPDEPERYGNNAADVAVLRIRPDGNAIDYVVELNTLLAPESTVVALAVDTDGDETTGGGAWPFGADVTTPGWEFVITVWGADGEVTFADGPSVPIDDVETDLVANTISFSIPRLVANPGASTWRYRGASGVWDADPRTWAEVIASDPLAPADAPTGGDGSEGQPDAFNLLFRNRVHDGGTDATDENDSSGFQDDRQAEALASGDITPFYRDVDFGLLTAKKTAAPTEPPGDVDITRIYAAQDVPNAFPEGVSDSGATGSLYNGRFQPYRMFVPQTYRDDPSPAPLLPLLHGWLGDHRGFNPVNDAFWNDVVRANRALAPKPLGRGGEIWYEHLGELDVLQVMDDVARHYSVDPDRIYLSGVSMGGLGTIKIASSHPDLFAGIFPSVPPMSDRAQGYALPENNDWDLADVVESLRNVPVRNFTGTYDALVPVGYDSERFCDRLAELAYDHICWRDISSGGGHRGYNTDRAADIAELMDEHPSRIVDPAHVSYASHPEFRRLAAVGGVEHLLRYDSVYWVSDIGYPAPPPDELTRGTVPDWPTDPGTARRLTEGEGISRLDVRTYGTGEGDPVGTAIEDDPEPTLIRRGLVLEPGPAIEGRNAFDLSVEHVLGFRLDLDRMGLTLDAPLGASLAGDGPFRLELGPAPASGCTATFGGEAVPVDHADGVLVIRTDLDFAGTELVVDCG